MPIVPEGLLGSLIAELFVDAIVDTVLWSTGALVLITIGYFLLV